VQKKRRAAIATAVCGIAFGCLLAIIGAVSVITDPAATIPADSAGGIPNWISGPLLILVGVGIAVPFVIELRRLVRESRGGL
jgi:TRAP-type C4-dicarboxylate transport system permease small subunit